MKAVLLLSTYNGEKYLGEQLASLVTQTHPNWELWVRDDGSTDRTREIVENFRTNRPYIHFLPPDAERLGPAGSFGRLLKTALATPNTGPRIFFFCDQDDVWYSDKIECTLAAFDRETPMAVHTDLAVVDDELRPLAESFQRRAKLRRRDSEPLHLLVAQNYVTGCTLAFNESLAKGVLPIPAEALMHDWWVALVAASIGRLTEIPVSTMAYRQHGCQASGGIRSGRWLRFARMALGRSRALTELMERRTQQTRALLSHLSRLESRFNCAAAKGFLTMYHAALKMSFPLSLWALYRLGIRMQSTTRTLIFWIVALGARTRLRKILS